MGERRYIISDASKMVNAESHVLRYWEDELEIEIPRNELGHRYYYESHIELFKKVKDLKEQGFQLKAIKILIPELLMGEDLSIVRTGTSQLSTINDAVKDDKMEQFKMVIENIVSKALQENNPRLSDSVIKEMDYLMRLQDEKEEERFKKVDELIRNYQKGDKESLSVQARYSGKKSSKFYKKNRRTV